jgi:hypothetical protein
MFARRHGDDALDVVLLASVLLTVALLTVL